MIDRFKIRWNQIEALKPKKRDKLVIWLRSNDLSDLYFAVIDEQGVMIKTAYDDSEAFKKLAENKEVIVWVPTEDVLLTTVTLPSMSRSRLRQAIPYAIEEQLVQDIETLHFAIGYDDAKQAIPVAVVAREKIEHWIAYLQSFSIEADQFIPACLALPLKEDVWYALIDRDVMLIRSGLFEGFACDQANLSYLLTSTEKPKSIHIIHTKKDKISLSLPCAMNEEEKTLEALMLQLANHTQMPPLNLLQGDYAVRKKAKFPKADQLFKVTTYLLVTWIILLFLYPLGSYFILNDRLNKVDDQINQIYKRNFPQAKNIIAPKIRMQEKLQKFNQAGENRFLLWISTISKGMMDRNTQLKRFDYQNGLLTLELTANTSEDFDAFTQFLIQQGLNVKQQNANLVGIRINATLLIE